MLIAMAVYSTEENNRLPLTRRSIESVANTVDLSTHRFYVINNGSSHETVDYLNSLTIPLTVIHLDHNAGTAGAVNLAWRLRHPEQHCIKMDDDVVIHQPDWVEWIEDAFDRDPSIGICGLKRKDLSESPHDGTSKLYMLPHERGQRWLIVEEVAHVIGTCQAYSSSLLDRIGYLVQPGVYGFDDALAAVRCRLAGFKSCFLHGFEIDHIDPGGDAFNKWKTNEAARLFPTYNTEALLYETGAKDIYYDGGFDD